MKPSTKVAMVIISYNTKDDLRKCLISARDNLPDCQLVVVDNGSTDGTLDMLKEDFPGVNLIRNPRNLGYASACNLGIAATREPFIFILNSDVEFPESGLDVLIDFMEKNPWVGVLGPLVLNPDGTRQMSCRRFPSLVEGLVHGFLGDLWPQNPFTRRYQLTDISTERPQEVDWVSGAAMLLRREAVEKVGGFDERYFMYVEDVDLCYRLKRQVIEWFSTLDFA